MGDYTLEQALSLASENASNTLDDAIHVNIDTREITVPQSQQLFGVESDADVEIKHIVIDGRYADGNRDLSKLAWRVIYRNANKETSYYLIPSVVANENSIELDWLIKRSVVAYKGTVDFILCAFATTSSGEVTPEWNSTLGQGTVLEGLETSAIDIGKESVDELTKILYGTIAARDIAKKASEDASASANRALQSEQASENIKQEVGTLSEKKKQEISELTDTKIKVLQDESTTQQAAIEKKGKDTLATIPEDYTKVSNDVSQLKEDVTTLKEKKAEIDDTAVGTNTWSSKHIIDMLCPPLQESGNPVVCYPVAGYALGVKAKWEPTQEGSGTPYPAGGGKNQLNPAGYEAATKTINGITFTRSNTGEVVVNGTATGTAIYVLIKNFSYPISLSTDRNWSIVGENVISAQGLVSGVTVIRPSDNTSLYIRVESGATVKTTVQPQIEKGNTPTAWAPYENIRPIKGRDSVTVERCGENLLDIKPFNKFTKNGITYEYVPNAGIHVSGTSTTSVDSPTFPVWHLPPGKYYGLELGTGISASIVVQRNRKNLWLNAKGAFEILAGDVTKHWYAIASAGTTVDKTVYPYIVPGTTAPTTYKPYIGSTNTLTLPETVYEGEVDAVSGEGQETWKMLTLDGTTNKFTQSDRFWRMPSNSAPGVVNGYATMCSHFPANTFGGNQTGSYTFTRADIMSRYFPDVNALNAYIAAQNAAGTSVQIAYKLAEPVPITATGAQPLPALAGANTVLTDADSATVTGRADPIKRITDLEDAVASQT